MEAPLPDLILIGDRFTDPLRRDGILEAAEAGAPWVHLRDHDAEADHVREAAREIVRALRDTAPDTLISINARLDVAIELELGVHAGKRGPDLSEAVHRLGRRALVGYSAHSPEDVARAKDRGAHYVLVSPIFSPSTKPQEEGRGVDLIRRSAAVSGDVPVYALGGIAPAQVAECIAAGAHGVAVLSGILLAPSISAAVAEYITALASVRKT
jgi:thiamine-phosphate pyrophosphorylase